MSSPKLAFISTYLWKQFSLCYIHQHMVHWNCWAKYKILLIIYLLCIVNNQKKQSPHQMGRQICDTRCVLCPWSSTNQRKTFKQRPLFQLSGCLKWTIDSCDKTAGFLPVGKYPGPRLMKSAGLPRAALLSLRNHRQQVTLPLLFLVCLKSETSSPSFFCCCLY